MEIGTVVKSFAGHLHAIAGEIEAAADSGDIAALHDAVDHLLSHGEDIVALHDFVEIAHGVAEREKEVSAHAETLVGDVEEYLRYQG